MENEAKRGEISEVEWKETQDKLVKNLRFLCLEDVASLEAALKIIRESKDWHLASYLMVHGISGLTEPKLVQRALPLLSDENPRTRLAAVYALTPYTKHRKIQFRESGQVFRRFEGGLSAGARGRDFEIKDERVRAKMIERLQNEKDKAVEQALVWSLTYSQRISPEITEIYLVKPVNTDEKEMQIMLVDALSYGASGMDICQRFLAILGKMKYPEVRAKIVYSLCEINVLTELSSDQRELVPKVLVEILKHESDIGVKLALLRALRTYWPNPTGIPKEIMTVLVGIQEKEKAPQVRDEILKLMFLPK